MHPAQRAATGFTMQSRIKQVPPEPWPSGYGEIIAMLDVAAESLTTRYGLQWFEGADNLDYYSAALVQLQSGRRLGFVRHHGDPQPGTEVHADVHDDVQDAVRELLEALELPETAVTWMREANAVPVAASGQVH
jgi:hypothetical protein